MTPSWAFSLKALSFCSLIVNAVASSGCADPSASKFFNLTAIAAKDGHSLFQCWQLTTPLSSSSTPGIVGAAIQQLGNLGAGEYAWLPANFPGTPHPAPVPQYVVFLSGLVEITMPQTNESNIFLGGTHAILFADDVANKTQDGHISNVLGLNLESLTIPTANGKAPPHKVLYDGVCKPSELNL